MNHKNQLLPVIALILVILVSLGCEATSQIVATQTPTITLTSTLTPSPTSTPTLTPTQTPTPPPDISGARILLEDLPAGFEELTPEEFGMNVSDLSNDEFQPEDIFIYLNSRNFQLVLGFNILLTDRLDRIGFDTFLNTPEMMAESFLSGMGSEDVRNQKVLEGMDEIGDERIAMGMETDVEGIAMTMNILMLRRDIVGGMIVTMYLAGKDPSISIKDLGLLFDKNIQNTLANIP